MSFQPIAARGWCACSGPCFPKRARATGMNRPRLAQPPVDRGGAFWASLSNWTGAALPPRERLLSRRGEFPASGPLVREARKDLCLGASLGDRARRPPTAYWIGFRVGPFVADVLRATPRASRHRLPPPAREMRWPYKGLPARIAALVRRPASRQRQALLAVASPPIMARSLLLLTAFLPLPSLAFVTPQRRTAARLPTSANSAPEQIVADIGTRLGPDTLAGFERVLDVTTGGIQGLYNEIGIATLRAARAATGRLRRTRRSRGREAAEAGAPDFEHTAERAN